MTENWRTYKNKRLTDHLECFEGWSAKKKHSQLKSLRIKERRGTHKWYNDTIR